MALGLSLIHISEPTRQAVYCIPVRDVFQLDMYQYLHFFFSEEFGSRKQGGLGTQNLIAEN